MIDSFFFSGTEEILDIRLSG